MAVEPSVELMFVAEFVLDQAVLVRTDSVLELLVAPFASVAPGVLFERLALR